MRDDPTLYEPWEPVSTCYFWGALISAGASLLGGMMASESAEQAADTQVEAARISADVSREALGFAKETYEVGRADQAPYRATGAGALQTMNQMFLPGGHLMVQMQGRLGELRAQRARLMAAPPPAPARRGTGAGGPMKNALIDRWWRQGGDAGTGGGPGSGAPGPGFSGGLGAGLGGIGEGMNDDMGDDW